MDKIQTQAMALDVKRRRVDEIQRIEAAFIRTLDGEYSFCTICGYNIEKKN